MSSAGPKYWWLAAFVLALVRSLACQTGDLVLTPQNQIASVNVALQRAAGLAYDAQGNLYVADARGNVVLRLDTTGVVQTVAGTGEQGFAGDGAAATLAQLDRPGAVAVASDGTVYIADTGNHRVRAVNASGMIQTVAGGGSSRAEIAAATSALLRRPSALLYLSTGILLIADEDDHRVRKLQLGLLTVFAGTGFQGYAGDGGAASAAELNAPSGLATDSSGNVYISDRLSNRVRVVNTKSVIQTYAGNMAAGFANGSGVSALFAHPRGLTVDAEDNLLLTDTGNHRVRMVTAAGTATVSGSGEESIAAQRGDARSVALTRPIAVAATAGGIAIGTKQIESLQQMTVAQLVFPATYVGQVSAPQEMTLTNRGGGALRITSMMLDSGFQLAAGSCGVLPITVQAGGECTQYVQFAPTATGDVSGRVVVSGENFVAQHLLLKGSGVVNASGRTATTTTLQLSSPANTVTPLTLTATVAAASGMPTGTVTFSQDGATLGSAMLQQGSAAYTIPSPVLGSHVFGAAYAGDANHLPSAADSVTQVVTAPPDFLLAWNASSTSSTTLLAQAGTTVTASFALEPVNGSFAYPVTFTVSGAPAHSLVTIAPVTVTPGASPQTIALSIQVPMYAGHVAVAWLVLFVPCSVLCWRRRKVSLATLCMVFLMGCGRAGTENGTSQHLYPITITGTAESNGISVSHSVVLLLTVKGG